MNFPLKVAYVENDPDLFEVIALALRKMGGFEVFGYTDVDTAFAEMPDIQPDAVFIDCAHVDGKTAMLLKAMRADPVCGGIPAILASDRKRTHQIRRYKAIGATMVIPTPINPFSLTQTIHTVISETSSQHAALASIDPDRIGIIEHVGLGR